MSEFYPIRLRRLAAPLCLVVVAACSESGDPATIDTNGLPFGASGQSLEDVAGVTMSLRAGGYTAGGSSSIVSAQTIRIDAGSLIAGAGATALSGEVEIGGETIIITDGAGVTSDGREVQLIYDPSASGTYAGALDIAIFEASEIVQESALVFGFETDPDVIAARTTGTLTYDGEFFASGDLGGDLAIFEGDMTLVADFSGAGTVSGEFAGELQGFDRITLDIDPSAITGNDFSGTTACRALCTGGGEISGTFYGPDAEEVGGVLIFDLQAATDTYLGAGTFVLTDPIP